MPEGKKTRQDTPDPTAKARDAQVPEPLPENAWEDLAEGNRPTGQGVEGKATHRPLEAATACTQATERAAKELRPDPKDEA